MKTEGQPDETLNLTVKYHVQKNAVDISWEPPKDDRYKGKPVTYEVHYSNMVHKTNPYERSNGK